ncbi:MAG TPA: hypothetical protein VGW38_12235, partial [Chloroflexota bacterium]|nr:hypothetical protein [Chloroflexota bacterium]
MAVMLAMMVALSGAALAQPGGAADVCVSIKGDTKVDKGESECFSDETSKAVAVNNSLARAFFDDSKAHAVNNSTAEAFLNSKATAVNDSYAGADRNSRATAVNDSAALAFENCVATARNDEVEVCF